MDLLHLMTSSDFNAIALRCPFHALAIVQVGFAGAKMFCALHVSEFFLDILVKKVKPMGCKNQRLSHMDELTQPSS